MFAYRRVSMVGLLVGAVFLSGCVGQTATPASQGRAYVVLGSYFGTDVYYCEADSGQPECWEVLERKDP